MACLVGDDHTPQPLVHSPKLLQVLCESKRNAEVVAVALRQHLAGCGQDSAPLTRHFHVVVRGVGLASVWPLFGTECVGPTGADPTARRLDIFAPKAIRCPKLCDVMTKCCQDGRSQMRRMRHEVKSAEMRKQRSIHLRDFHKVSLCYFVGRDCRASRSISLRSIARNWSVGFRQRMETAHDAEQGHVPQT